MALWRTGQLYIRVAYSLGRLDDVFIRLPRPEQSRPSSNRNNKRWREQQSSSSWKVIHRSYDGELESAREDNDASNGARSTRTDESRQFPASLDPAAGNQTLLPACRAIDITARFIMIWRPGRAVEQTTVASRRTGFLNAAYSAWPDRVCPSVHPDVGISSSRQVTAGGVGGVALPQRIEGTREYQGTSAEHY